MKTGSWCPARVLFVVLLTITLSWGSGKDASGQTQQGKSVHLAKQVLVDPGALHQRLKSMNTEYNGQAQFAQDPTLGLVGDFNGSRISYLSPLADIPFNALDLRAQPISDLKPLKGMPQSLLHRGYHEVWTSCKNEIINTK